MQKVTLHAARGNKPVVRLVPVTQAPFKIGILQDKVGIGPDFLAPMDQTDLDLWDSGP